jgi:hypothetical protein
MVGSPQKDSRVLLAAGIQREYHQRWGWKFIFSTRSQNGFTGILCLEAQENIARRGTGHDFTILVEIASSVRD